jgi:hypothetical protein
MTNRPVMRCLWASGVVVALTLAHPAVAAAAPTNAECDRRVNDTTDKLVECIQEPQLFRHLSALQRIADENPDPAGHGNRDTGKPGYRASVNYVADLVAQAGYKVTIQPYTFTDFQLIYVLTRGGPLNATHLMATLSFQRAIPGGALGEGAALATYMIPFLLAAIMFSYFGLQRRGWQQGGDK